MIGFLAGLSLAVPTLTRFVLWNPDEFAVPIDPSGSEGRELAGLEAKPTAGQTDEPRLEATQGRQVLTGL